MITEGELRLTVSSLEDFHGIRDVCLSLPTVVNHHGVARKIDLALTSTELNQLQRSGEVLRKIIQSLDLSVQL